MKNNILAVIFLILCLGSALVGFIGIIKFTMRMKQLERLQPQLFVAKSAEGLVQSIYKDTIEYGKAQRNPADINRVIQSSALFHPNPAPVKPTH